MITRVPGVLVGHWTDARARTGCTVVLCPVGTVASGEARGGAPGTRETDLLRPGTLVQEVNAVLLAGGSAFGLAAADGVMRFCEERGAGFKTEVAPVPIVPAAVIFDLAVGDPGVRPGPDAGYAACVAAGSEVPEGNVGAGTGATVAKLRGMSAAIKGGVGSSSREEGGVVVGALAVANGMGEVVDESGRPLAAPRSVGKGQPSLFNTTLVVVATNATLSKERAHLLSMAAHDGITEAVRPAHTMRDGDVTFALSTGELAADQRALERLATSVVADAIRRAVLLADGIPSFPSAKDVGRLPLEEKGEDQ